MSHQLDGAKAKIERAIQHISDFQKNAHPFERSAYTVRVEPDPDRPEWRRLLAKDMRLGEPPVQLILLAGEIAYQLRSALDHVVHQLILVNHQTPTTRSQFPIFETSQGYKSRAPAMVQGITTTAETIIESVQPYQRGASAQQDPLWMLKELNNADKHRVIPTAVVYTKNLKIRAGTEEISVAIITQDWAPEDGTHLASIGPFPDPNVQVDPEVLCTITFAEVASSKFEPVVPFFTQAITYIDGVVEKFRGEF